jgi:hypothetical protein
MPVPPVGSSLSCSTHSAAGNRPERCGVYPSSSMTDAQGALHSAVGVESVLPAQVAQHVGMGGGVDPAVVSERQVTHHGSCADQLGKDRVMSAEASGRPAQVEDVPVEYPGHGDLSRPAHPARRVVVG